MTANPAPALSRPLARPLSRRGLIAAGAVTLAAPFVLRRRAVAAEPLRLSWNAGAVCFSAVPLAFQLDLFKKHGLEVELVNFTGSTDQLLEAIATGKADAGVGMALRWLKPLEQGFDVKISAGLHGGCMRLFGAKAAGVKTVLDLPGKVIGVSDMASPSKNFFSVVLTKFGLDPNKDVEWRQFPADLLGLAVEKGEIHAIADGDPLVWSQTKNPQMVEITNNVCGEFATRTCCLVGVRGSLLRDNRPAAKALTAALIEAQHAAYADLRAAAAAYAPFAPKFPVEELEAMLRSHAHNVTPIGDELRQQLALYTDELKSVSVIKRSTDSQRFAGRITVDLA
ncbi:ABC transporter substrate-binding protein [Azospirillum sp. A29]|uniref:ABC transporter substrate-binding protein n=1 Tax=Azospirillum sp. A29 TaxID=3160606 RepID=UPI00366EB4F4